MQGGACSLVQLTCDVKDDDEPLAFLLFAGGNRCQLGKQVRGGNTLGGGKIFEAALPQGLVVIMLAKRCFYSTTA